MEEDNLLEEALENVSKERTATKDLLSALKTEISSSMTNHSKSGIVAAKYVETLQRSNEQLVKLIALRQKKADTTAELSEDDKAQIFDMIQGPGDSRGAK